MSPQAMAAPIVVHGEDVQQGHARNNPAITTETYFSNFAGGYLVGASVATHPAGQECGPHDHRGAVEMFRVDQGSGVIEVGTQRRQVHVGDCIVVPQGVRHNLIGTSHDELFVVHCTLVVAPGHEDDPTPWKSTTA